MRPWRCGFITESAARAAEIDAFEIDREYAIPLLGFDILDQGPRVDSGILYQNVEAAMFLDGKCYGALGVLLQRNIDLDEVGIQPFRRGTPRIAFDIGDHQSGAFFGKTLGHGFTDSARCADEKAAFALQSLGHASFCLIVILTVSSSTAASTNAPRIICV